MLLMNGSSWLGREADCEAGEDLEEDVLGHGGGDRSAITNAIEMTAPVFWSITRAPAAMPRRCAGTTPIIAAVFGLLNMPEPMPTRSEPEAALQ